MSRWQRNCDSIVESNTHLITQGKFSNVVFIVGQERERVLAHKLILISRSAVFERLFEGWGHKEIYEIDISSDSEVISFVGFLRFLYTDTFHPCDLEQVEEILSLAHIYDIPKLCQMCSEYLINNIKLENVIRFYEIAIAHEQFLLAQKTSEYFCKNLKGFLGTEEFLRSADVTLAEILKRKELDINQVDFFESVIRWSENRCKSKKLKPTPENLRAEAKNLIPLVKFHLMTQEEFNSHVVTKRRGFLTDKETVDFLTYFQQIAAAEAATVQAVEIQRKPTEVSAKLNVFVSLPTDYYIVQKKHLSFEQNENWGDGFLEFKGSRDIYLAGFQIHGINDNLPSGMDRYTDPYIPDIKKSPQMASAGSVRSVRFLGLDRAPDIMEIGVMSAQDKQMVTSSLNMKNKTSAFVHLFKSEIFIPRDTFHKIKIKLPPKFKIGFAVQNTRDLVTCCGKNINFTFKSTELRNCGGCIEAILFRF